jgi:Kef-type K+ transport system membrane component KefB
MVEHNLIFPLYVIFASAAVLATVALITRQSMLVAYIVVGIILGPWGLKLIGNAFVIKGIGDIGIIFLLFLLGLHLPPQKLLNVFKQISWVTLGSAIIFSTLGYFLASYFGFTHTECLIIGAAMMFSSTIFGIKLLPTTVLHHQHTGEMVIGVLLLQDIIAILVLLFMNGAKNTADTIWFLDIPTVLLELLTILFFAFLFTRFFLVKLFVYFSRIKEYIFLVAVAWCLGMSLLTEHLGFSMDIGAFIAGVSLATSPIALYIADRLRSIRDFCLVLFFFSIGANFNLDYLSAVIVPAIAFSAILLLIKPIVYYLFLRLVKEPPKVSWEVGFRLNQISEFSLIIAYMGLRLKLLGNEATYLIEAVTIITLIISSYLIIFRYPTPIALSDKLRRD